MFRHIVLLAWVAEATEEQKAAVEAGLKELPGVIPELLRYEIGPDAGVSPGNFDFAVVADFASVEDYMVYRDHPTHLGVIADVIRPILANRVAAQYSF
ncbi:Dabb family protein [Sphaerisporangium corydalis]|uniref:Dabb family protein n=1 Tax=Sphaerisporangium corydalis TaxID=1441875 RepID=A0ABV9ERI4_9ACTN|nr:Dabb family protein [Sphaerisporangium corydalis]